MSWEETNSEDHCHNSKFWCIWQYWLLDFEGTEIQIFGQSRKSSCLNAGWTLFKQRSWTSILSHSLKDRDSALERSMCTDSSNLFTLIISEPTLGEEVDCSSEFSDLAFASFKLSEWGEFTFWEKVHTLTSFSLAQLELYVAIGTLFRNFENLQIFETTPADLEMDDYFAPFPPKDAKLIKVIGATWMHANKSRKFVFKRMKLNS